MTQTLDAPPGQSSASDRAEAWFRDFEAALKARDVGAASGMFAASSFWRDLVSFTWNLTTVENPPGVAGLLEANLERVDPSGFALTEPADEAGGVVTAWFGFETSTGRGSGLLRLKEEEGKDKAWTFLTSLYELKGHEEPRGTHRPMGAEHGASKDRRTWKEKRQAEAESLGSTTQPYVLVIGGGQGGIALGSRLRQLGVPDPRRRQAPAARRPVAQQVQVALPPRPGLVRPPAVPEVPRQLAGVRAEGQDRRLAGVVREGDGGAVLVEHHGDLGHLVGGDG